MKIRGSNNSAVVAFWQKSLLNAEIITLAKKYRAKLGMPISGFVFYEEWEEWREKNLDTKLKEKKRIQNFSSFVDEAETILSYQGVMSKIAFRLILLEFYYFNRVDNDYLEEKEYSEFKTVIIKNGKKFLSVKNDIENGVYIKIGPYSPINKIKKYIDKEKQLIKNTQSLFAKTENIPSPVKTKIYKNFKRDELIVMTSQLSNKELDNLYGRKWDSGTYREDKIAKIIHDKTDYKNVTSNSVKMVLRRRQKMIKALKNK